MIECDYPKKDLLKAMLCIAKRERPLTRLEQKYDKEISPISENRFRKINSLLVSKGCVKQVMIVFDRPDPSTVIGPMLSSDGQGLTETGEDELRELIESYQEEMKSNRRAALKNVFGASFGWIMGIIATVIGAILIFILGVN